MSAVLAVGVYDPEPVDVEATALPISGRASVRITEHLTLYGDFAGLRAVAVEIDRQLAHLEVGHRIDEATT